MNALRIFIFLILPLALLLNRTVGAEEVTGQLSTTADAYPSHLGPETEDLVPYLSLELGSKHRLSRHLRAQWKIMALGNLIADGPPEKFYGDIPEGFFELKYPGIKLRVGMNTLNWGVVDVMSPSDTVNTLAVFHPLRQRKQGAPIVEAIFGAESLNLDLVYIPVQRAPQLPSKNSRWLPRSVLLNLNPNIIRIKLPDPLQYEYTRNDTLDHALNNNYGAKLASHLGSLDLQLTHFEGASPTPRVRPLPELVHDNAQQEWDALSPIYLTPLVYRVRTTGVGFVWAHEKWLMRGESAYQHVISHDDLLQQWSWASVLAVESNFDLYSRTLTLIAQYYYTHNPQPADNMPTSSYRLFDRTPMLGGRFAFSDALTFLFSGLYETETQGVFWSAAVDYKMSDQLRFSMGWRDFSAQRDGLLKTYERNDHSTIEMTYYF